MLDSPAGDRKTLVVMQVLPELIFSEHRRIHVVHGTDSSRISPAI